MDGGLKLNVSRFTSLTFASSVGDTPHPHPDPALRFSLLIRCYGAPVGLDAQLKDKIRS